VHCHDRTNHIERRSTQEALASHPAVHARWVRHLLQLPGQHRHEGGDNEKFEGKLRRASRRACSCWSVLDVMCAGSDAARVQRAKVSRERASVQTEWNPPASACWQSVRRATHATPSGTERFSHSPCPPVDVPRPVLCCCKRPQSNRTNNSCCAHKTAS
jgi:hypothetical protein